MVKSTALRSISLLNRRTSISANQAWMALPFGAMFVALLCLDARLSLGLNVLYAEISAIIFSAAALFANKFTTLPKLSVIFFTIFTALSLTTLILTNDPGETFGTIRNITVTLLLLVGMATSRFSLRQISFLLKVFVFVGVICSIIGIHQSLVGYDSSVTVFNLGLEKESEIGTGYALKWKLDNLNSSGLFFSQKGLAIGLHQYSNNFAEYLIYVMIANITLRQAREFKFLIFTTVSFVVAGAVFFSQSRTCQIAFFLIIAYHILISLKRMSDKIFAGSVIAIFLILVAPFVWVKFFSYDGFGTVEGRASLDSGAIYYASMSVKSVLFGGNVREFYSQFVQDPHNVLLFLWLQLGAISTLFLLISFIALVTCLASYRRGGFERNRAVYNSSLVACSWFFIYGMTWSVINVGLAGLTWAFIVGCALSLHKREAGIAK